MPRHLAALGLLLLAACSGVEVRADLASGMRRRVLPNGLAVVAVEDPRLPTVTAMLAYRVGSVDEPPGMTGVSHFFEHMVFKGTRKYPPGAIDRITQRCGGENNAFTTHDMTGYWFHVHSSHLDEILDILADTMGNCTLDPAEFERERGPVLQEMAIWQDSGWGPVERELGKTVYRSGAYRHPVLGWKEDVEKLTRDRMADYYRRHYHPNNASLVIVGNLPVAEMFRKAEAKFGAIPSGTPAGEPGWREPVQDAERKVEIPTPQPTDRFILAFRAASAGSDDDLALDLLSVVLGEGRTSRLVGRLADELDLASQDTIQVYNESRRREGVFEIRVELALDADLEEARGVVLGEVARLRDEPVTERELRRAKNILRAKFAFESESQFELASKIGYFEALGRADYVATYMDRIESLDAMRLREVARRILRPEGGTWALGRAKGAAAPKRGKPWHGLRPRQAAYEAPVLGEVRERVLPNGLTLIALRRPGSPVLSLQAHVQAGQAFEPPGQGGVARLTGELLAEGIEDDRGRRRGAEDLASELEFVGGEFMTGPAGLAVKVLSEHSGVALDLVRDLLRFPSFPRPRFEALKEDLLADIESQDDDPDRVARRLFFSEAFKGHPFERPATGTLESVRALELKHVREYHRRQFRPERTIVAAVGDLEPDAILGELEVRLGAWAGAGAADAPAAPAAVRGGGGRTVNHRFASQQVRIRIGHVGVERTAPDWAALRVTETILCSSSGFTNRLAMAVREREGLAYDVGGSITAGAGPVAGPFEIALGVDPKQKDRAVALVKGELKRFLDEGPTEEELADAKRYLLASQAVAWETAEAVASWLLEARRHALGYDAAARFHREVSAVGRDEVARASRKRIDLGALVTVVVGPVDKDGRLLEGVQDR